MNWDEFYCVWREQEPKPLAESLRGKLSEVIETDRRHLARKLFWRDIREALAGVLVIGFSVHGMMTKFSKNPTSLALMSASVALMVGVTGFYLYERIRSRRRRLGPDAPTLAKIDGEIDELRRQRWLLWNVAIWGLGPIFLAWALGLAAALAILPHGASLPLKSLAWYVPTCVLLFGIIWRLNRKVVKKRIDPKLSSFERLRAEFLDDSPASP